MSFTEYGKCHTCKGTFTLKKNGALRVHSSGTERLMNCSGSGSFPAMQQYGVRYSADVVFSYRSRGLAERAMRDNPQGGGVLVVHEGIPGTPADEWTDWAEVQD